MDAVFQIPGEIEISAETCVNIDMLTLKVPVFVKFTLKCLSAKVRFYYNSINEDNWLQWLGKPVLKVDIEPSFGEKKDYNLKAFFPKIKAILESFLAD